MFSIISQVHFYFLMFGNNYTSKLAFLLFHYLFVFQETIDKLNNLTSANLDHPEGGLDAMMQAVVCQVSQLVCFTLFPLSVNTLKKVYFQLSYWHSKSN